MKPYCKVLPINIINKGFKLSHKNYSIIKWKSIIYLNQLLRKL